MESVEPRKLERRWPSSNELLRKGTSQLTGWRNKEPILTVVFGHDQKLQLSGNYTFRERDTCRIVVCSNLSLPGGNLAAMWRTQAETKGQVDRCRHNKEPAKHMLDGVRAIRITGAWDVLRELGTWKIIGFLPRPEVHGNGVQSKAPKME